MIKKYCTTHRYSTAGFSLIEMIVSMALFSVVSTITVGTIIVLIGSNKNLSTQQNQATAVAFSLDNMTREIRMGNWYFCDDSNFSNQPTLLTATRNCNSTHLDRLGRGISFVESSGRLTGGLVRIAYYLEDNSLWRRVGNNQPERLLPEDIVIDMNQSRFFANNNRPISTGGVPQQPRVTIQLSVIDEAGDEVFFMQTTIVQRSLKI